MRVQLIGSAALLLASAVYGPVSSARAALVVAQAPSADFTRPDVAPLPAEGKFQVVSDSPWPGDKVRVFFLGAQF
jgi:hypothetical protein